MGGIAWAYVRFGRLPEAEAILYGVKPVVIAIVVQALWRLGRTAIKTPALGAIALGAAVLKFLGVHELLVLLGAGLVEIPPRLVKWRTLPAVLLGIYGTATPDGIPVLRVKFKQKGKAYEETCLVSPDLDNYPRITCYLYTEKTKKVGLETLFPDHGQLVKKMMSNT